MVKKFSFLFLFCSFWLAAFAQESPTDSTKIVTIRSIHIIGNKLTKERIITRELSVKEGDSYSLKKLADTLQFNRNRVYNTNLFNTVEITIQEIEEGVADLLVKTDERWYIYPMPVFKLADRNFNDWWVNRNRDFQRVNYGIRYTQFNFRGRAERLRLIAQSGFEDRVILNYKLPYIDKKQRHGLTPEVFILNNKNLGYETRDHLRTFIKSDEDVRRSVGVSIVHTYRKRFYDYHFTGLSYANINVADTIAYLNPNYLGNGKTQQQFLSASYGYQHDTRDNINYPKTGHNLIAGVSKIGLGVFGDVDYWSMNFKGAQFWNFGKGYSGGTALHGYWSSDTKRPFVNYWGIGFDPKIALRGYELDLIEGSSYIMSKNSSRKLLWNYKADISNFMPKKQFQTLPFAFYGKVFFDGAYIWNFENNPLNDRLTDKFIYATGVGLDIVTLYDTVIRLEYSTNWGGEQQFFLNFAADL